MSSPSTADGRPICSAKGCRAAAAHLLVWNNPRLHTADREKTWSACAEHRDTLGEFLNVRGFLRRIDSLPTSEPGDGNRPDPEGVQPA